MKKISLLLLTILYVGLHSLSAQSAIQLYKDAQRAMNNAKYERAIQKAIRARASLGRTNPKIEGLLAQAYYYEGQIIEAKVAYEKLIKLMPSRKRQSSSFAEFKTLGERIDQALEKQQKDFEKEEKKIADQRMRDADHKVRDWEDKEQQKISKAAKTSKNASYFYNKAKRDGSKEAYREYLASFPKSDKARTAKKTIKKIEDEEYRIANEGKVWRDAKNKHSISAYEKYLRIYPDGQYVSAAKEYVYQIRAKNQYNKAVNSRQLADYEYYYNNYKRGKDLEAVKSALLSAYKRFGDQSIKKKNWEKAKLYYSNYKIVSGGNMPQSAKSGLARSDRMLRQKNFDCIGITYDANSYFGVLMGRFKKDRMSWYGRLKMRQHIFFSLNELNDELPENFPSPGELGEEYYVEETGQFGNDVWQKRYAYTGNNAYKNIVFSLGLSQKVFYPLWINVGVGVGYFQEFREIQIDQYERDFQAPGGADYNWNSFRTGYIEDKSAAKVGAVYEAGLSLFLKPFVFQAGINSSYGEIIPYFGFGLGSPL